MRNRILNVALWSVSGLGLFVLLVAAVSASHNAVLTGVVVKIDYAGENFFLNKEEVENQVFDLGYIIDSTRLDEIDPARIEHMFTNNAFIEDAEVYKQLNGALHVDVKIRQPILRIFSKNGKSIYLDNYGVFMPLSFQYTARTPIANGNISIDVSKLVGLKVKDLQNHLEEHPDLQVMSALFDVASACSKDAFWRSQFNQFYINSRKEIELIPRVGDHQILVGDAEDLDKKLYKLRLFYAEGLNKTGWNEYKVINLKYANQVVCTKS